MTKPYWAMTEAEREHARQSVLLDLPANDPEILSDEEEPPQKPKARSASAA